MTPVRQRRAIIADRKSGVLVDPNKVHAVNYQGKYFSTRGPLNSGPAPQGQPVIIQAGASGHMAGASTYAFEACPLVVDGVVYVTGPAAGAAPPGARRCARRTGA